MAVNLVGGLQNLFDKRHGSQSDNFATLEDFSDRLNRFYTSTILLILAGVTVANVYFLKAISCNLPHSQSTPGFSTFAESVCWVQGTIGLDKTDRIPANKTEWDQLREKSDISFYQWVPFYLAIQAIMFFLPYLLWQGLSINSLDENFNYLVTRAKSINTATDKESRASIAKSCAYQLNLLAFQHTDRRKSTWATYQKSINSHFSLFCQKHLGNRAAMYYLLIKLLYLLNCCGQLWLIIHFIGPSSKTRTDLITFLRHLYNTTMVQKEWGGSELFPLQTLCPIKVPELGARHQLYTAICTLPVNMLNIKIYMFLWVWILAVALVSFVSLCVWSCRLMLTSKNQLFLTNYLRVCLLTKRDLYKKIQSEDLNDGLPPDLGKKSKNFYEKVVGLDGVFLLRMLRINAGDVATGEILLEWWSLFEERSKGKEEEESKQEILFGKV